MIPSAMESERKMVIVFASCIFSLRGKPGDQKCNNAHEYPCAQCEIHAADEGNGYPRKGNMRKRFAHVRDAPERYIRAQKLPTRCR